MQKKPQKTLVDSRQLSSEEQIMLTRPVIALEYYDGQINPDNYNKGNLLNSGINVSKIKNDRGRSQNIAPVYIDQSQA